MTKFPHPIPLILYPKKGLNCLLQMYPLVSWVEFSVFFRIGTVGSGSELAKSTNPQQCVWVFCIFNKQHFLFNWKMNTVEYFIRIFTWRSPCGISPRFVRLSMKSLHIFTTQGTQLKIFVQQFYTFPSWTSRKSL